MTVVSHSTGWPEIVDTARWGRIHVMRDFATDKFLFKFEKDGVVISVDPHEFKTHEALAGIVTKMRTEHDLIDRYGAVWLKLYEGEYARLCPTSSS